MSKQRSSFKQADAARALKAAVAAGLYPSGYTIGIDGSITVNLEVPGGGHSVNSFDKIMGQSR
ncbi:hypothetical protein G7077_11525 [Sphingomonas piscis]|uniref:Uncharacterized protein n=1 Tax=Sphingomonas piscis TaxID=2714943 RepID=A0A6G7YLC7_9SPHN|nr:hypothetical protein [Sphingomonas piscis]QIK77537.1 hypothetical protein G7077_11525 [Sphingomonas piscis]